MENSRSISAMVTSQPYAHYHHGVKIISTVNWDIPKRFIENDLIRSLFLLFSLREFQTFQGRNREPKPQCMSFVHVWMAQASRNCRKKGAVIEPVQLSLEHPRSLASLSVNEGL